MSEWDDTTMGGAGSHFPETHWSLIARAQTDDETRRRIIINELAKSYWKPVYCYIRKRGYSNDDAKELTQDFFCDLVIDGNILDKADRAIGSFRALLVVVIKRFLINHDYRQTRKKRHPERGLVSLDAFDPRDLDAEFDSMTPEQAFYRRWITDLLDQVLADIREEYDRADKMPYWELFRQRVLAPIMENRQASSLDEICPSLGIADTTKASNMIVTVKRRFRAVLQRRLRETVRSDDEAEQEFEEIMRFLSEECAG